MIVFMLVVVTTVMLPLMFALVAGTIFGLVVEAAGANAQAEDGQEGQQEEMS
jgi:hypothetical protein